MPRVKRGVTARARHKKILKQAKGYYGARSRVYRVAKQAVIKAGQYAYRDRKQRKRQFRALWIVRINAASRMYGISYSRLINGLTKANVKIDRKVLADIAVRDIESFGKIAAIAKANQSPVSELQTSPSSIGGLVSFGCLKTDLRSYHPPSKLKRAVQCRLSLKRFSRRH